MQVEKAADFPHRAVPDTDGEYLPYAVVVFKKGT